MKKTIVALGAAALLGSGVARAEPIVSVYGDSSTSLSALSAVGSSVDFGLSAIPSTGANLLFDLADRNTDAGDLLSFTGSATGAGLLSFGLRAYNGSGPFLVRITSGAFAVPTPEPASLFLIGAGLIGTAGAIRRRQSRRQASTTA